MIDQLIAAGLIALAVAGVAYVFLYPSLSGEAKAQKRTAALIQSSADRAAKGRASADLAKRRKAIADSLKDVDDRSKKGLSLEEKLVQAGLLVSKGMFLMVSGGFGLLLAVLLLAINGDPFVAVGGAAVGMLGLPNWLLSFLRKRRLSKFVEAFPNAIDIIIRGVKAGLPVADCFRVIANESPEPVRGEFRLIVEAQSIGLSVAEAAERLAARVPIPEASFFSTVINIQQKAGGNLSEALGNLSGVLRARKVMREKIKAMSAEAKASAGIIGSLPFLVGGAVFLTTPSYMMILFTTSTGKMILGGGLLWMLIGVLVMRKMINFDI